MEHERKKLKGVNTELVKQLEEEKLARKTLEGQLSKFKEDAAREQLEKDKTIVTLQINYEKVKIERA